MVAAMTGSSATRRRDDYHTPGATGVQSDGHGPYARRSAHARRTTWCTLGRIEAGYLWCGATLSSIGTLRRPVRGRRPTATGEEIAAQRGGRQRWRDPLAGDPARHPASASTTVWRSARTFETTRPRPASRSRWSSGPDAYPPDRTGVHLAPARDTSGLPTPVRTTCTFSRFNATARTNRLAGGRLRRRGAWACVGNRTASAAVDKIQTDDPIVEFAMLSDAKCDRVRLRENALAGSSPHSSSSGHHGSSTASSHATSIGNYLDDDVFIDDAQN